MAGASKSEGKAEIFSWISEFENTISTVLDIGAGSGTYANKAKENNVLQNSKWIAVEVWPRYIKKFKLSKKYAQVIQQDARNLDWKSIGEVDLIIAGDVLEHMHKDEAIVLFNKCLQHSRYLIISMPIIHFPQGPEHENPYEEHIKDDWSHDEIIETFSNPVKSFQGDIIGAYLFVGRK